MGVSQYYKQNHVKPLKRFTMTTIYPICFQCKHFHSNQAYTCNAFPEGIPEKILFSHRTDIHNKPLKNQKNSIVFEPLEENDEPPIIDDEELEFGAYSEQCSYCKHLLNDGIDRKCRAFPEGIPKDIWKNKKKHDKPLKDQLNEIIFEKKISFSW